MVGFSRGSVKIFYTSQEMYRNTHTGVPKVTSSSTYDVFRSFYLVKHPNILDQNVRIVICLRSLSLTSVLLLGHMVAAMFG